MRTQRHNRHDPEARVRLPALQSLAESWVLDGEVRRLSNTTLANRRLVTQKLLWFLEREGYPECGVDEMRAFFAYLRRSHEDPDGRWGNGRTKTLTPAGSRFYHAYLASFWSFAVAEGAVAISPMTRVPPPVVRQDQIVPFTDDQVKALLDAARRSKYPKRDVALVLFMYDTGARASEVCSLRVGDLHFGGRRCTVIGKGQKKRTLCFGQEAAKVLWTYVRSEGRVEGDGPLFLSERNEALTRSGLLQLLDRLGKVAGVHGVRCSPHTLRHTMAISYLRAGGDVLTLQQILGHEDLAMTRRYTKIAEADVERAHRQFSPADRLRRR